MIGAEFYPTPEPLIDRMLAKVKRDYVTVLEPSAGKGDIVDRITDRRYHGRTDISVIEIDDDLRATLIGKRYNVLDTDFLAYSGPDKFDLIIGNPPFSEGDKHLMKALDIMYNGEIVFLVNAETIRNPHTRLRQELTERLSDLGAEIEYIEGAFVDAERPTGVTVAMVYANVERQVENDLFAGATDEAQDSSPDLGPERFEVSTGRHISELVAEFNQVVDTGTETIVSYYRNYPKIGKYIGLNQDAEKDYGRSRDSLTSIMTNMVNQMVRRVRKDFWHRTLDLREVKSRMTSKKLNQFESTVSQQSSMDFTENNIRQFVLNLIGGYEQTLMEATLDIFDKFTVRHCFEDGIMEKNIHYYNGWKTNKAFKVGKRVVVPIYGGYGEGPFRGYGGEWKLNWDAARELNDIDKVMNYFDGMEDGYLSISRALEHAFSRGESSNIRSTYFTMTVHKKGTIHLTFRDEDILRRFNLAAGQGKGWLPNSYGKKPYHSLELEERAVVDAFEGEKSYTENLGSKLFSAMPQARLQIAA